MKLDFGKTGFKINVSFAAAVTLMLILDGTGVCAIGLFCCVVHECGHIICLLIIGEKPKLIEISFYGIKLERVMPTAGGGIKELAVYASGPAANFVLSLMFFALSRKYTGVVDAAAISLGVGLFNLIPCRPLDGGNLLFAFCAGFMSESKADMICFAVKLIMLVPMTAVGFVMLFRNGNFTLLGVTAYLVSVDIFDKKRKGG